MSPRFRLRNQRGDASFVLRTEFRDRDQERRRRDNGNMGPFSRPVPVNLCGRGHHNTLRVADSAFFCRSPVRSNSPFGERRNTRLKELIRGNPEEVRDPVDIPEGKFSPGFLENLTDPALAFVTPLRQVFAALAARPEQRFDVVLDEEAGFHGP